MKGEVARDPNLRSQIMSKREMQQHFSSQEPPEQSQEQISLIQA